MFLFRKTNIKCNDNLVEEMLEEEENLLNDNSRPHFLKNISHSITEITHSISTLCSDGFSLNMGIPLSQNFIVNFGSNMVPKSAATSPQEMMMNPRPFCNLSLMYANKLFGGFSQLQSSISSNGNSQNVMVFKGKQGGEFKIIHQKMKMANFAHSVLDISFGQENKNNNYEINFNSEGSIGYAFVQRLNKFDLGVDVSYSLAQKAVSLGYMAKYRMGNKNIIFNYSPLERDYKIACINQVNKNLKIGAILNSGQMGCVSKLFYSKDFDSTTIKGVITSDFNLQSAIILGGQMNPLKLVLGASHSLGKDDFKFGYGVRFGSVH